MTEENIKNLIFSGEFCDARNTINANDDIRLEEVITEAAYEQQNIICYAFIVYLISQNETVELHRIATDLMINPLCFMEGAYVVALHHVKQAISLNPHDTSLKEYILFLYEIPEEVVSRVDAKKMALDILQQDPDNKAAQEFLAKYL